MVNSVGSEAGEVADKDACAAAVGGMRTGDGGAWRSTVADTTLDDSIATISSDIATTYGPGGSDGGGRSGEDRRQSVRSGEDALLAINRAVDIGGIGSHIVGAGRIEAGEGADEGSQAAAISGMEVADRGFG